MRQPGSGTMRKLAKGDAMLWMHGGKQVNILAVYAYTSTFVQTGDVYVYIYVFSMNHINFVINSTLLAKYQ